jgi:hypothetical protein
MGASLSYSCRMFHVVQTLVVISVLEVEAIVRDVLDSDRLKIPFPTDIPSGKYEEIAELKMRKTVRCDEIEYKVKIELKEEEFYSVYVNLYMTIYSLIGYDMVWLKR